MTHASQQHRVSPTMSNCSERLFHLRSRHARMASWTWRPKQQKLNFPRLGRRMAWPSLTAHGNVANVCKLAKKSLERNINPRQISRCITPFLTERRQRQAETSEITISCGRQAQRHLWTGLTCSWKRSVSWQSLASVYAWRLWHRRSKGGPRGMLANF